MKKTQKELGAVHLRIEGLDKERFKELVDGHNVYSDNTIEKEIKDFGLYIENFVTKDRVRWVSTDSVDENSRLITLDELEQLLGKERTPEVIQSEIDKLKAELAELTKVNVGDVVLTDRKSIGIVELMGNSEWGYYVGNQWYQ